MGSLELTLGDTKIVVTVLGRDVEEAGKPYLDWIKCNVQVSTLSFSGSVRWSVMPCELTALAKDLVRLYDDFPKRGALSFNPSEPNISMNLTIRTTGAVDGELFVRDNLVDGDRLHCRFTIEQSQLPTLAREIRGFVEDVTAAA